MLGRVAQLIAHLTQEPEVPGSSWAVVSYWRKYMYEILVNRSGGLYLLRKSAFRLTDRPDMNIAVYCGRGTTTPQQAQLCINNV